MRNFNYLKCRCCDNENLVNWLRLPDSPVANALFDKPDYTRYPLVLNYCEQCGHLQLAAAPDPDSVFSKYRYRSGVSKSFQKHFSDYALDVVQKEGPGKVLEIGSNDGYLLQQFAKHNCEVVGVEPSDLLRSDHEEKGVEVVTDFFTSFLVDQYSWENKFDIVCANNVLAHIPDTYEVMRAISKALKPNGILVAECGDQKGIISGEYLDNVYHEHIDYYSPNSFATLAKRAGLVVEEVTQINTHGVSFRIIARKKDGESVTSLDAIDLIKTKEDVLSSIEKRKQRILSELKDREFVAYGAAAKAVTSLYSLGIIDEKLIGVVDDNDLKQGMFFPGTNILIENPENINPNSVVLVAAWNVFNDIKEKLLSRGHRGEILCM